MNNAALALEELVPSRHVRLVAVEANGDGTVTLYEREAGGAVSRTIVPFQFWLLTSGEALAGKLEGVTEVVPLEGTEVHNVRVHFQDEKDYFRALKELKRITGYSPSSAQAPYRCVSDLTQQFLALTPARLFRGLAFAELRRLQLDIETVTSEGFDFPNAERENDAVIVVALRDSTGWEHCLAGPELSEAEILRETVRLIRERDPDVIEGHNIFNFDLPYIETRCKRHGVKLALGRDGRTAKGRSSRFNAGERSSSYRRYDIHGRHVVDTLQLVQLYDVSHRDMDSYGLKDAARYFGVAAAERTYVAGADISHLYRSDPARLKAYAMDDVRETEAISRILSPSHFYQTQLVPLSFQNCITRGNATRIDALLTAEYMVRNASLPSPRAPRQFQGGLTAAQHAGVFKNVWHVDVRSLYPSIIISHGLSPRSDRLGIYLRFLSALRDFRLAAKDAARSASGNRREHYEALQSSFKVLINSFYGYAGFARGTFNDFDLAETVTTQGREILERMLRFLEDSGARVLEMDTDGIYFVPAPGTVDEKDLLARLQAVLPAGIEVDLDNTYAAMFAYKSKNYALLDHDGKVSITGAGLKSRGLEPFQRNLIREIITLLLRDRPAAVLALFDRYEAAIREHELPLADFAKREVLSTPPNVYREKLERKQTRRSAAYELVLRSEREYRQGDAVVFYVTGEKKNVAVADAAKLLNDALPGERDENVPYYLQKLRKLKTKFATFLA